MKRYVLTKSAKNDLGEIWFYYCHSEWQALRRQNESSGDCMRKS